MVRVSATMLSMPLAAPWCGRSSDNRKCRGFTGSDSCDVSIAQSDGNHDRMRGRYRFRRCIGASTRRRQRTWALLLSGGTMPTLSITVTSASMPTEPPLFGTSKNCEWLFQLWDCGHCSVQPYWRAKTAIPCYGTIIVPANNRRHADGQATDGSLPSDRRQ
jgi:hypothetical protein